MDLRTPGWVVPTEAACSGDVFICLRDQVGEVDGGLRGAAPKRGEQALKDTLSFKGQFIVNFKRSVLPIEAVCQGSTDLPPGLRGPVRVREAIVSWGSCPTVLSHGILNHES